MGTLRRYHEDNRAYSVTALVKDRRPLLADPSAATLLRDVLDTCRQRFRFLVLSYAIMPDHVHAVIVPGPGDGISAVMRYIKGAFARLYNAAHNTHAAIWQARSHDVAIRNERELITRVRYVEENPVRAGLAAQREHHPFSSATPGWRSDLARYLEVHDEQAKSRAQRPGAPDRPG